MLYMTLYGQYIERNTYISLLPSAVQLYRSLTELRHKIQVQ